MKPSCKNLKPEQEQFIKSQIDRGSFKSADEAVAQAFKLLEKKYQSQEMSSESQLAGQIELTLDERRAFLRKPLAERRAVLAQQAEQMLPHYQSSDEWRELIAGDI